MSMRQTGLAGIFLAWAIALLAPSSFAAELTVEAFVLRYRTAEQVLPLLAPHVAKPGTVSGAGNEIVIRTSPSNLAEVRKILATLDRAPRRLLVTVRQDAAPDDRADGARSYGTRGADADRSMQQVQVLDGREAEIRIGRSVPVTLRGSVPRVVGGQVVYEPVETVQFRDVLSGFAVRPRLAGDTVVLELSPRHDTPGTQGRGSMDVQRIATTLSGRLGEWIEVGTVGSGAPASGDAVVYSTRPAQAAVRRILVRVEAID